MAEGFVHTVLTSLFRCPYFVMMKEFVVPVECRRVNYIDSHLFVFADVIFHLCKRTR